MNHACGGVQPHFHQSTTEPVDISYVYQVKAVAETHRNKQRTRYQSPSHCWLLSTTCIQHRHYAPYWRGTSARCTQQVSRPTLDANDKSRSPTGSVHYGRYQQLSYARAQDNSHLMYVYMYKTQHCTRARFMKCLLSVYCLK